MRRAMCITSGISSLVSILCHEKSDYSVIRPMSLIRKHQLTDLSPPSFLTLGWPQAPCQYLCKEVDGAGQHLAGQEAPGRAMRQLHLSQDKDQASLLYFTVEIWHDNSRMEFTPAKVWVTPGAVYTTASLGMSITDCREVAFITTLLFSRARVESFDCSLECTLFITETTKVKFKCPASDRSIPTAYHWMSSPAWPTGDRCSLVLVVKVQLILDIILTGGWKAQVRQVQNLI